MQPVAPDEKRLAIIGNPVKIGSGPAAVTPSRLFKEAGNPMDMESTTAAIQAAGRPSIGRRSQKTCRLHIT